LHAGTFAPGKLDGTFGPEQVFCGVPNDLKANRPPSEDYQFFGKIDIDARTEAMTVSHYNSANTLLWSKVFPPG
jgi:alkaline phosphatase D